LARGLISSKDIPAYSFEYYLAPRLRGFESLMRRTSDEATAPLTL
jgi:hypothetical protein